MATWLTAAGATSAQQAGRDVVNGQVQLGDVFATQTLNVTDAAQLVSSATTAGNLASAIGQNADLSFTNTQTLNAAKVSATAEADATKSAGTYLGATSSATGNSATAGTCCGVTSGKSVQNVTPDSYVYAQTIANAGGPVGQLSADSLAVGSTQGWLAANGTIQTGAKQTLNAAVAADTEVKAGYVLGESGSSATAVGNDVTVSATKSGVDLATTQTSADNSVTATLTVQQQAGDAIFGQATATGNNVSIQSDGASLDTSHTQTATTAVTADAAYGLGSWNTASVGAYGVGNSVLVSTAGPSTDVVTNQTNGYAVTARASLLGGGGGDSVVSSTAIGNAVSAYVCATCDGGVGANNTQTNRGAIAATSVYRGPSTGSVTGAASAVGNTATYQVKSSGG